MKIYINRQPIKGPWGGGAKFINAFHKHVPEMGHEVVKQESINNAPDIIMLAGLDNDGIGISAEQAIMYKMMMETQGRDVKLMLRVNENDARKGTSDVDDYLLKIAPHVDVTVFVSNWLKDYFIQKNWGCSNNTVIINGVDSEIFKPQPKLNNGKINIAAHHWSDNKMKGFDIYELIDEFVGENSDKFTFNYIGRDRRTFKHTNVVGPLSGKKLGEELGKYDVYVSASRFDPGPNHCSEALASGLPTYVHTEGGGCVEFAGKSHSFSDWDELKNILTSGNYSTNTDAIKFGSWESCIGEYVKFMESIK